MAEARILISGEAIKALGMSDFQYSKFGCILGFKYVLTSYRHCVNTQRGISSGYYDYDKYLDYIATTYDKVKPVTLIPFNFEAFKATTGDSITVYQRNISQNFLQVCWYTYKFPHVEDTNYGEYKKVIIPNGYQTPLPDPNACDHVSTAQNFYNNYISKAVSKNDISFAETLADIEQQIEYIENNIFSNLTVKPQYSSYIGRQRDLWDKVEAYDFLDDVKFTSRQKYERYLSRLTSFALYFQSYIKKIGDDSILVFLYLAAVMSSEAIQDLLVDIKLRMLTRLAIGDVDNWQLFFYKPEDDESVVVKIVDSITEEQADDFLDGMLQSQSIILHSVIFDDYKIDIGSLYDTFYDSISNKTLGLGKDNLTKFIRSMYNVWAFSNYNPYNNGVFSEINLKKFNYNNRIATNPDPSTNWWKDVLDLDNNRFDFTAAPVILNYTSKNVGGIYFDNFDFYFDYDKDFYGGNERLGSTGFGSKYANLDEAPKGANMIFAVKQKYTESGDAGLYGTYHYYQPVMLVNSNQETVIRIPVINGKGKTDIDGQSKDINSLVPMFVLKYIDDLGDESDFYTIIGYTVDIVSIVAGGYGLATKLKYLRGLSGFTQAVVDGTETGNKLIFRLYLSAAAEGLSFFSSTVSFLMKLTGDEFKDEPWYETLVTTVTWIELLSGGGSVLADKMLKISCKNLVNEFNSLPQWPDEFILDPRGAEARSILTKISGVSVELLSAANKRIRNILDELWKKENKLAFSKSTLNGSILHTDVDISEIIRIGYLAKLPEQEIAELIHISYRRQKQIETSQLILQVRYYAYVTRVKEYPAGFSSLEKYENFCSDMDSFWKQKFLEFNDIPGIDFTNIHYEIAIQGSAIRKRVPGDPLPSNVSASDFDGLDIPDDIEFAILMEKNDFDSFLDQMTNIANKITGRNRRDLIDNIKYARRKGNFAYFNFDLINENILSTMEVKAKLNLKIDIGKVNFSITQKGSRLDLGPYLPFKYK